ncbi:MAG: serine hydrolase [Coriobacteriia bacterium]|nr:serine hydrolase [Coriobacteriia bacterium]
MLARPRPSTIPSAPRALSLSARLLLAGALASAVLSAPGPALAARAVTDEIAGTPLSAGALPSDVAPDIDAAAGILVDSQGRALWSRQGDTRRAMASTTKMMTALLVLENGGLGDTVTVSKAAARVPYGLGLKAGEKVSVRRLLELTLVASANDGAHALGEHVSGDMSAFVGRMNERARELGLEDTRFANPHGLDASGHYSTPSDLAALAQTAMELPEFRRIVSLRTVTFPAYRGRPARSIKSTDKLLGTYRGLTGVKTGFTRDARHSFVGTAGRDGVELTAVILGADSGSARFTQTARLLDWGFKHLRVREVSTAGETVAEVPIASRPDRTVPVRAGESASLPVFGPDGPISLETSVSPVTLPVFEGQPLGEVRMVQGDRELVRVPALAATSTVSVEETVGAVPVSDYLDRVVTARAAPVTSAVPEFDPDVPVDQRVDLEPHVAAPVAEGDRLGEIAYIQGEKVLARVPVIAAETVEPPGFVDNLRIAFVRSWRGLLGAPTMAELEIVGS